MFELYASHFNNLLPGLSFLARHFRPDFGGVFPVFLGDRLGCLDRDSILCFLYPSGFVSHLCLFFTVLWSQLRTLIMGRRAFGSLVVWTRVSFLARYFRPDVCGFLLVFLGDWSGCLYWDPVLRLGYEPGRSFLCLSWFFCFCHGVASTIKKRILLYVLVAVLRPEAVSVWVLTALSRTCSSLLFVSLGSITSFSVREMYAPFMPFLLFITRMFRYLSAPLRPNPWLT